MGFMNGMSKGSKEGCAEHKRSFLSFIGHTHIHNGKDGKSHILSIKDTNEKGRMLLGGRVCTRRPHKSLDCRELSVNQVGSCHDCICDPMI